MDVIFTDLDGTLLDHDTYSWEAAQPALDRLKRRSTPWIPVTSKTRAEVEEWRGLAGNPHPFVVENGGAAYIPAGYFPFPVEGAKRRGAYEVLEWGTPYATLVAGLERAASDSGCRVRGFHQMTALEIAEVCDLPPEQAELASRREYDEPFLVLDPDRAGALVSAIAKQELGYTRGGRFWHILGASDKAVAVEALVKLYERCNSPIRSIGLGDSPNDAPFLNRVDVPVLIRSPKIEELKRLVPLGQVTGLSGPQGWNEAVLSLTSA